MNHRFRTESSLPRLEREDPGEHCIAEEWFRTWREHVYNECRQRTYREERGDDVQFPPQYLGNLLGLWQVLESDILDTGQRLCIKGDAELEEGGVELLSGVLGE